MPNHCGNELTITGPTEELKRFKEFAKSDEKDSEVLLELNKFESFLNKETMIHNPFAFSKNGYLWGTKWGCYEFEELKETDTSLQYIFLTAWGPYNANAANAMAKAFPKLRFHLRYAEIGVEFCGEIVALDGKYYPEKSYCIKIGDSIEYNEETEKRIYKNGFDRFSHLLDISG